MTIEREIRQNRIGHSVPVVHIMRRELIMPFQFAGIGIQRHETARVEIVTRAHITEHDGARIPRTPESQIGLRIVGSGDPGGTAAVLPTLAGPGLATQLTLAGHGVEAPYAFAGVGVISIDESARAELGPGHP